MPSRYSCIAYGARSPAPASRSAPFADSVICLNRSTVPKPNSLRAQLVLWTMLPMFAVLVVSAVATYLIAFSVATRAFDYSLQDEARTIAARVHMKGEVPEVNIPSDVREVLEYDSLDKVYYD